MIDDTRSATSHDRPQSTVPTDGQDEYRNFFENAADAMILFEPEDEIILQVNTKACEIYGFTRDEFIGISLKQLTKNVHRGEEQITDLLHEGSYTGYETIHFNKAGDELSIMLNSSVIDYRGKKAILSINRDFTGRKRVETMLHESVSSYRGLFNSVSDSIYVMDANGRFVDVNDGATTMYGYTREEFIGQTLEHLSAPGKNKPDDVMRAIARAFMGQPQQFEYWGKRKNGDIFQKEIRLAKSTYFGEEVIVALSQDITERKKSEQILRDIQRRESIGILSSGIAHDFNNLLGAMMGNVTIAQSCLPVDHPAASNLERAINAMERAANLTKQILAYSGKGQY